MVSYFDCYFSKCHKTLVLPTSPQCTPTHWKQTASPPSCARARTAFPAHCKHAFPTHCKQTASPRPLALRCVAQ